ncbi:hypothetical protein HPB51_012921 [Rhipicephalus microplus]|uniref:Uncharacterized protein n=1 Tax=Rhipicephalus microplus TaxID=6941 RepID=A0A9J6F2I9_RHIMP|nr:hypothetical protein HPB51_012921 [Rhipicephalus microplus]
MEGRVFTRKSNGGEWQRHPGQRRTEIVPAPSHDSPKGKEKGLNTNPDPHPDQGPLVNTDPGHGPNPRQGQRHHLKDSLTRVLTAVGAVDKRVSEGALTQSILLHLIVYASKRFISKGKRRIRGDSEEARTDGIVQQEDNRTLLLPWLVSISLSTLLDIIVLFYLTAESDFNPFIAILFITDVFIAVLNVYCLLCVSSLYQEYRHNRGRTVRFLGQQYPDNMKRSTCRKRADAEGKFSPTKPSVFIADDMVSSSITKLSTSTTRRSSALSSCRLTPIKEESQARPSAPADTLHQSLGATGSGENLSHVYLVSPRPSPVEKEDDEDDEDEEEAEEDVQRDAVERQQRGPLPVTEVVSESVYKWAI